MTTNPASTEQTFRRVVAEIVLSLDGRVNGAGGEYDMSWIIPHAISDTSRDRTAEFTQSSTTALVGRKNYEGFAGYWPSVADDESADLRDRTFSRWVHLRAEGCVLHEHHRGKPAEHDGDVGPTGPSRRGPSRPAGRGHHRAGEQQRDPPAA